MKVKSFKDVMAGRNYAEILCAVKGTVVRKLTLKDGVVRLDAITASIDVPVDTEVVFAPWCMDRGSLLFNGNLKLCTELDKVRYPDGLVDTVEVA